MKRSIFLVYVLLFGFSTTMFAQESAIEITGLVVDKNNEPMIGVTVSVSDVPGLGTVTGINGEYRIKMDPYHRLIFSFLGYEKQEVLVKDQKVVNVVMKEADASVLNEVVVTAGGAQQKLTVTGAVTTVEMETLKSNPSGSISSALAGNVAGILAMSTSGKPGSVSEFWVRGISTFGAGTSALVLVDGFERNLDEINVEDVESISVLKDASETAMYGSKGANGVLLITTKRGKSGKVSINFKSEGFYNMLTQVPKFVDGYQYASMANEAKITRAQEPLFQPDELEIFRLGLDPDLYPNVDWMDLILRDGSLSHRHQLNLNGGGNTARYFVSASYLDQQGMYKTDKIMNDYETNANYHRWNYRANVDMDITKTTLLKVGLAGSLSKQNDPGVGTTSVWTALMGYNAITSPVRYSNGYVPVKYEPGKPDNPDRFNPWTQATETGYRENWVNNIQTNVSLEQNFDFITKGLRLVARYGYDTNNDNWITRYKFPELWEAEKFRSIATGEIIYRRIIQELKMRQTSGSNGSRNEFFESELHYSRGFQKHHVGSILKYNQASKVKTVGIGEDLKNGVARRNQGLSGRVTYDWDHRYFVNFNFGYTGSENFAKGNRFGFFPAASIAWNIAQEPFIQKTFQWMEMFKLRFSYGKVGNDNLGDDNRFPYIDAIETIMTAPTDGSAPQPTGGYQFADIGSTSRYYGGIRYSQVASPYVTWEIAIKADLGIDFSFFRNKISGSIDYFDERRTGIYMTRQYLPGMVGLELNGSNNPKGNVGEVNTRGFDGNFALHQKVGDINLTVRGNITYNKNEIIAYDEDNSQYPYKMQKGFRVNQSRGLIAMGLFKDYDDIRKSPVQSFDGYKVMPGDIKYKDVNGDGKIDDYDRVPIGATSRPNLIYGAGVSVQWKGLDVNVHFQGAGKSTLRIDGSTVYMFQYADNWGNILESMANSNRWISADISGDPATENPNADYPRLTYGNNPNNNRESTFWLRDRAYLRLKTAEVGYTIPQRISQKIHCSRIRLFFIGTNLLTWSAFKLWDPEMGSTHGKNYPLNKNLSLGVSINL